MTPALVFGGALGIAAYLIVTAQPVGRPRPDLATRLRRLSVRGRFELAEQERTPRFASPLLERVLRPLLDDAGDTLAGLLARVGLDGRQLDRVLALTEPGLTAAQFRGQQLALGLVALAAFPLMNLLGVQPFGPWPVWMWGVGFVAGFAAPGRILSGRWRARREALIEELPVALDLFAIAASAGLSPEQALNEVAERLGGPLGESLRGVTRDAAVGAAPYGDGLSALADREDIGELRSFVDAWRLAQERGLPFGPSMLALAESVRERRRVRMREEGGKGAVRMLIPVAVFIFPVLLIVLLFPAGLQLLGLGNG